MKKILIIIILLVLIIAGCVGDSKKDENNNIPHLDGSKFIEHISHSDVNEDNENKSTYTEKKQGKSSDIVDCGTVRSITIKGKEVSADEDTIKAWECFTDNLKDCTPAKLKVLPPEEWDALVEWEYNLVSVGGEYKIIQKEDNLCKVSGPSLDMQAKETIIVTCEIPEKYIEFSYSLCEKRYLGKKFMKGFTSVGAITAGVGEHNIPYPDGTKEKIICKK